MEQEEDIVYRSFQLMTTQIVASNLVNPYLELRKAGKSHVDCLQEVMNTYSSLLGMFQVAQQESELKRSLQ